MRATPAQENNYPQFSTAISEFCELLEQAKRDYDWNRNEISRLDQLTQDYLHMLELGDMRYKERAKVATKLADCRQLRRDSKDTTEILGPLVAFLESENGKRLNNLLHEVLGKTRKVERQMEKRVYVYRVYEDGDKTYIAHQKGRGGK